MKLLDKLLSVAAPMECISCSEEGAIMCWGCLSSVTPVPSRCYRCYAATAEFDICVSCRRYTPLRHVWVGSVYDSAVKELIRKYKFERALSAHQPIAELMIQSLPMLDDVAIVAVPTATSHRRKRGYDHALLLAKEIAFRTKNIQLAPVVRVTQASQVGASRKERFAQLEGSFLIHRPDLVKGKKVLLVDDVITTGATVETLAKMIKRAGAKEVNALVCAQKL